MAETKPNYQKLHISEQPITLFNWYRHVNWINISLILVVPIFGCIAAFFTELQPATAAWAILYYFWTGLGITAGYHRLWAHRSYEASLPLKIFLACVGGGAVQGSIRWWSSKHRAHHRWTDTVKDLYSVRKGVWYSHFMWMAMKQNPKDRGRTDISDLNHDSIVVWQHRHYGMFILVFGMFFPMMVAGLGWGDWQGGLVYAGILRFLFVQQASFCVNSLAHWLGDQPFDDRNSPRDHVLTALKFPSDYRNAIEWWQYDPTKWSIWAWKQLGLASNLKQFRANEIEKGRVQQLQKKVDQKRAKLDWGVPLEQLPVVSWDDFEADSQSGKALTVIAGVIHDLTHFIHENPGGKVLINSAIGKDATAFFNGGVYSHSNAAHNLLSGMRVGVIRGGGEVGIWRRRNSDKLEAI
ncbi:hypothetical protein N7488_006113 [Penicillium malachiteum]|nr:hypothetical protein N7488_006113 [Penicillium malachiteum]